MLWGLVLITLYGSYSLVASQHNFNFVNNGPKKSEQYTLELLVVVDYSAYLKWYHKMIGDTHAIRKKHALTAIWKHYSSVIHGIDTIFKGLETSGLKVAVEPVDIQVVSSDGIVTSPDNIIASEMALSAFFNWTIKSDINLPDFDHAMLITGYDLMEHGDISKSGRAYLETMCTRRSVSVVENDFSYEIVQITAHEIGHSLGAKHDGQENPCNPNDGYLMASVIEINSTHRWYMSPCSVGYIANYINGLYRSPKRLFGKNCLLVNNHENEGAVSIPMGELYTPDDQCALIEGAGSYFCRDFYSNPQDYSQICSNIWCHVTNSRENICNNYEGSDGYVCGDKKVCVKGKCLFKENATGALDYCPQGDQPGVVWKNYTCSQLVFFEPEMCYDDNTRSRCCLSCMEINQGVPGAYSSFTSTAASCEKNTKTLYNNDCCEFGDKSSWCRTDLVVPMGCYKNENLCCGTCRKNIDVNRPSCRYGDRSLWCERKLMGPHECYQNEELCCGTCAKYFNASLPEGCGYGDRSTWCATALQPPYDCYKNSRLCCKTCAQHYNPSNKGCEYGDRSKWCETDLVTPFACYLNSEFCCKTCNKFFNASRRGCEYGDRNVECKSLVYPVGCYQNDDLCCDSCTKYRDDTQPTCKYGDKSTWCQTDLDPALDCHLNLKLCCGTCGAVGSGSHGPPDMTLQPGMPFPPGMPFQPGMPFPPNRPFLKRDLLLSNDTILEKPKNNRITKP